MSTGLQRLKEIVTQSSFYRSPNYSINANFKRMFHPAGSLISYNSRVEVLAEQNELKPDEVVRALTPEFQRSNARWSQAMQIQFVENLLCGCETKIQLYDVGERGGKLDDCLILDGLQRLTAIAAFHNGEFAVFDELFWNDLNGNGIFPTLKILVNIYTFGSDLEACKFYIQMNKGITHSEQDLKTAYDFIRKHEPTNEW
ncbi:DUF262 domain-containing protein [Shewanella sp. SM101]|jgi:hypothetical protein|uniref:DUF262 domain-containing protein n=1 Tax=Shewanella TaxID=22 RepID=UPI0021D90228|nr:MULTISPECIES: DUF262 domain-containing protein [unclassified Shewanella]MCU8009935.1 DUF262 domain-containing protein [Shewanella sp. SM87]MCU8107490.1 DUF262 domain-containing protein [Shewanella sp. SM101]